MFRKTSSDNTRGLSVEDRKFLSTMDVEIVQNSSNYWVAPLPFRSPGPRLSNNRKIAYKGRLVTLRRSLSQNPVNKKHYLPSWKICSSKATLSLLHVLLSRKSAGTCHTLECTTRASRIKTVLCSTQVARKMVSLSTACCWI